MAVIDIRGTHGSGKSWIAQSLLKRWRFRVVRGRGRASKNGPERVRPLGYAWGGRVFVVGTYPEEGFGGGCDLLFPEEVVRRVELFCPQFKFVVLEGILVSHTFARYSELASRIEDYRFCFLNTPLKKCIERVRTRRLKMTGNKHREFNDENIIKDWHQIRRVRDKCIAAGHQVVDIQWKRSLDEVLGILQCR